ncbi:serine/threonine-protein phosphatase CPPED1-like [Lineus longissimus]|uniref:serine/threonine-protein phosphatase CPPED1-like n=1 Tax=Lineus longissimus TaxID=88925 RepID=UPI002B4C2A2F
MADSPPRFGSFVPSVDKQLGGFEYANNGEWKEPFYFVQVTDIQYGMMGTMVGGNESKRGWSWEIDNSNKCVEALNRMVPKPKFVIVTGDIANDLPGQPDRENQECDFRLAFSKLVPSIPLFCIPGNHDIGNTPTPETVDRYKANFGDDYFSFWCGGVKFISPNTQYIKDPSKVATLKEDHDRWLEEELADSRAKGCKQIILLQHIPWFLKTPDEPDDRYFNIPIEERAKWLKLFKESGVRYVFSGHYHRESSGRDGDLEMTVTSALGAQLGSDECGFRIIKVHGDQVTHRYVSCDDAPLDIDLSVPF